MKTYDNLEQRMASSYTEMLPPFVPNKKVSTTTSEQAEFYNMMQSLFQMVYSDPLLLVSDLHEDDAFPNNMLKKDYAKPKLSPNMGKFIKVMDSFLDKMYRLGKGEVVKFTTKESNLLAKLGISIDNLPKAWVWMANRNDVNLISFMWCFFDNEHSYATDIYKNLTDESVFQKLENWMLTRGYQKYEIRNSIGSDSKLSLVIANPLWSKKPPTGGNCYKILHSGISIKFEPFYRHETILGLCIPNGIKEFLLNFDQMEEKLKNFVVERTTKCHNCKYCVQTDKTKTRPLALIKIKHAGTAYNLCPYFSGDRYQWTNVNEELAELIINFLEFMDKFIEKKD